MRAMRPPEFVSKGSVLLRAGTGRCDGGIPSALGASAAGDGDPKTPGCGVPRRMNLRLARRNPPSRGGDADDASQSAQIDFVRVGV